ncbi:hypothetical protein C8J56DRAFT_901919 [Mycena floridula]|nr:hypothetical protein C8J56DRAFT_901919 [Mycena floridula]
MSLSQTTPMNITLVTKANVDVRPVTVFECSAYLQLYYNKGSGFLNSMPVVHHIDKHKIGGTCNKIKGRKFIHFIFLGHNREELVRSVDDDTNIWFEISALARAACLVILYMSNPVLVKEIPKVQCGTVLFVDVDALKLSGFSICYDETRMFLIVASLDGRAQLPGVGSAIP